MRIKKKEILSVLSGNIRGKEAQRLKKKNLCYWDDFIWRLTKDAHFACRNQLKFKTRINLYRKYKFCPNGLTLDNFFKKSEIVKYDLGNMYRKQRERAFSKEEETVSLQERFLKIKTGIMESAVEGSGIDLGYLFCDVSDSYNFRVDIDLGWNGCSKYPRREYTFHLTSPCRGLFRYPEYRCIDGLHNIDIKAVKTIGAITVLSAVWLEKTRGYDLHIKHGYIAMQGKYAYHAESLKKAVNGLKRKIKNKKVRLENINMSTVINVKDYMKITGACRPGCRDFVNKHNLPSKMVIKDLLPVLKGANAWGYERLLEALN